MLQSLDDFTTESSPGFQLFCDFPSKLVRIVLEIHLAHHFLRNIIDFSYPCVSSFEAFPLSASVPCAEPGRFA